MDSAEMGRAEAARDALERKPDVVPTDDPATWPDVTPAPVPYELIQDDAWKGLRVLCLGCGGGPVLNDPPAVNHDRWAHSPWVDVTCDLGKLPWKFEAAKVHARWPGPFDVIVMHDVIEHLEDVFGALNQCWELLGMGGVLEIRTAAVDQYDAYVDPTHRHWFRRESFDFVDRSTFFGSKYGRFYLDSTGMVLLPWTIEHRERVDADPSDPAKPGNWLFVLRKVTLA